MAWTRIDGLFLKNGKIQRAGVYGMALYLSGLIYCNQALTDGFIDEGLLNGLCGDSYQTPNRKSAGRLVELGLWEKVKDGYLVHDFLEFNRSKEDIEKLNLTKKLNGTKGGRPHNLTETKDEPSRLMVRLPSGYPGDNLNLTPSPNHLITITKTEDEDDNARGKVFIAYENEIGYLTPFISESLIKALDEFSETWVLEAIHEAAIHSGKSFKYVEKVLLGWKQNGFKVDVRTASRKPAPPRVSAGHELDHILEGAPIFAEDK